MDIKIKPKTILIAPLNWGLGHATRCIPVIRALLENNYIPIIASDGIALTLLQKEFPNVQSLELPSYQIEYAKKGANFKWKLLLNGPKMMKAILDEKKIIQQWVKQYKLDGIISDNRLGIFSKKIPSIFITHQLNVMTGNTTWLSSKIHQSIINKYTECWVPDLEGTLNLSGKLGHVNHPNLKTKYIGPLSRLQKKLMPKKYDLMVILSGPEPQRSLLEKHLKQEILVYKGSVIFIEGNIEKEQKTTVIGTITYYNFMNSIELEQAFNESQLVLCRSGYTTIMDLAQLRKKAFFIPTPGQYEQEYLAEKFQKEGLVPFTTQANFKMEDIEKVERFKGLPRLDAKIDWNSLFEVFENYKE